MRLGVFGGSFDPVHFGHLLLAECCREQCALDRVWFVPAATAPHKSDTAVTPAAARIAMLELAIAGHGAFDVSTVEVDRGGLSYTVETLDEVRRTQPDAELFLLLGADSLVDLASWREPARICELATPVVVERPDLAPADSGPLARVVPAEVTERIERHRVEMPAVGFSSSDIRRRVAAGLSIRYRTPRAVEKYIDTHGLYRGAAK
ncbi:MAG: nicotinate-nucleotide adenylyltransferase [Planctomycetales bacterium]|nr:nicotinate-nucleotide adenylyltransferase [Planctomycetales bacterium]